MEQLQHDIGGGLGLRAVYTCSFIFVYCSGSQPTTSITMRPEARHITVRAVIGRIDTPNIHAVVSSAGRMIKGLGQPVVIVRAVCSPILGRAKAIIYECLEGLCLPLGARVSDALIEQKTMRYPCADLFGPRTWEMNLKQICNVID